MNDPPAGVPTPDDLSEMFHIEPEKVREVLKTGRFLTPPQVAKRWGVKPEKVIAFINSGELWAFDISMKPGVGRPRYRVPLDAITKFEKRRAVQTPPKRVSKPKRPADVINFSEAAPRRRRENPAVVSSGAKPNTTFVDNPMIHQSHLGDNLSAALEYSEMGWLIVPLVKGKKCHPRGFRLRPFIESRPLESDFKRWFVDLNFDLAVRLGDVSDGLCLRDFDCMPSYQNWTTHHSRLATALPTTATGRDGGGRHVFFTADVGDIRELGPTGRTESLHLEDGGHLKGGGIAVLPPSTHHTGRNYRWIDPPDDVPFVSNLELAGLLPPGLAGGFTHEIPPSPAGATIQPLTGAVSPITQPGRMPKLHDRESQVDWAVRTSIPTAKGQRHAKLFELIRRLQAIPVFKNADPRTLQSTVWYWHSLAKPHIGTKDFEESWKDFLNGWHLVAFPFGDSIILAKQRAKGQGIDLLESLCRELQAMRGNRPFYLGTRLAGNLAGVSHTTAAKWFKRLIDDGKLTPVETGVFEGRRASSFFYTG